MKAGLFYVNNWDTHVIIDKDIGGFGYSFLFLKPGNPLGIKKISKQWGKKYWKLWGGEYRVITREYSSFLKVSTRGAPT